MPIASPASITIGSETLALKRVNQDNNGSTFLAKGTGVEYQMKIRHSYENSKAGITQMERHNLDLLKTEFLTGGVTKTTQCYFVLRCERGSVVTAMGDFLQGLAAYAGLNADALVEWEV